MRKIVLFASVAVFLLMGYAFTGVAADHSYVGVGKCKMCHKSKAKGDQYGIWLKSAHSKAYETLASDESKAVAAKLGLEGLQGVRLREDGGEDRPSLSGQGGEKGVAFAWATNPSPEIQDNAGRPRPALFIDPRKLFP